MLFGGNAKRALYTLSIGILDSVNEHSLLSITYIDK